MSEMSRLTRNLYRRLDTSECHISVATLWYPCEESMDWLYCGLLCLCALGNLPWALSRTVSLSYLTMSSFIFACPRHVFWMSVVCVWITQLTVFSKKITRPWRLWRSNVRPAQRHGLHGYSLPHLFVRIIVKLQSRRIALLGQKHSSPRFHKRSMDLGTLLASCTWYDIGNFLQTCIKNSLLQTKSLESRVYSHTVPHYARINFRPYSTP